MAFQQAKFGLMFTANGAVLPAPGLLDMGRPTDIVAAGISPEYRLVVTGPNKGTDFRLVGALSQGIFRGKGGKGGNIPCNTYTEYQSLFESGTRPEADILGGTIY